MIDTLDAIVERWNFKPYQDLSCLEQDPFKAEIGRWFNLVCPGDGVVCVCGGGGVSSCQTHVKQKGGN